MRDLGWALHDDDLGNVYLTAPDHRIRLGYIPEGEDDALWRINAHTDAFAPTRWAVTFNTAAPTEFVTAFTTALASAYTQGPDAYLHGARRPVHTAVEPLLDQGWTTTPTRTALFDVTAPDGKAGLTYDRRELDHHREMTTNDTRWYLWGGTSPNRPDWYATFSSHTPVHLVTATTTALADPTPVARYTGELSRFTRTHAQLTPIPPPIPTPLDVRRAQAARARNTTTRRPSPTVIPSAPPSARTPVGRRSR
ncbi:DUF317 domain-containing protein [Streptomyces olivoreticuli]